MCRKQACVDSISNDIRIHVGYIMRCRSLQDLHIEGRVPGIVQQKAYSLC